MRHQYLWFLLFFFLQRYLWSWQKKKKILGKKPNFFDRNDWEGRLAVDNQTFFFLALWIKTVKILFWPITQELLDLASQILMLFLRSLGNFIDAYYFSNRNDREGRLAVDNQTFFFFCLYYGSKQSKYCFDQLKNCLTYLNFNTIFEILGQFSIRCIRYIIFKKVLTILR